MDEVLIPVAAILMPLGIVTVVTRARQRARHRDYEHRERMRALEVGISPYGPAPVGRGGLGLLALGMGAIMPAAAFLFAWMASMTSHVHEEAWMCAMVVGIAGVIGGSRIGLRVLATPPKDRTSQPELAGRREFTQARKPSFNPDAYDPIAHRS